MIVLVINNGSNSSRFSIIETDNNLVLAKGGAENIGSLTSYSKYENLYHSKFIVLRDRYILEYYLSIKKD